MKTRILLDTNVIIDALQSRTPWAHDAQSIFLKVARNEFYGYITTKSVADIHYIMHRYLHDEPLTRNALCKLFDLFDLLDATATDCRLALLSPTTEYEDAILIETAVRCGIHCIITRNNQDFVHSPVCVLTPSEFLTKYTF